jgi:hypothetical protein
MKSSYAGCKSLSIKVILRENAKRDDYIIIYKSIETYLIKFLFHYEWNYFGIM